MQVEANTNADPGFSTEPLKSIELTTNNSTENLVTEGVRLSGLRRRRPAARKGSDQS